MINEQNFAFNANNTNTTNSTNNVNQVDPITIATQCIAEIDGRFFLLLAIEILEEERVFVIRLTSAEAAALIAQGVGLCTIQDEIPVQMPGRDVDLVCAFVVGNNAYLVFIVESNGTDEIVLVRVPLCTIVD